MWENNLLYVLFLGQIFYASYYFPKKLLGQMSDVITNHPPMEYPKLYPVSKDVLDLAMGIYKGLNLFMVILGLGVVIYGSYSQSSEMLNLDSTVVILAFFMMQYVPLVIFEMMGFKYMKLMRNANKATTRKAELRPRNLFSYISPVYLWVTVFMHVVFASIVLYFMQNPFDGFGGVANFATVIIIDIFFGAVIMWQLYAKKKDPYQALEDRLRQNKRLVKMLVVIINLAIFMGTASLIIAANDSRHLIDIFICIYFLLLVVISFQTKLVDVDNINFDVYKEKEIRV